MSTATNRLDVLRHVLMHLTAAHFLLERYAIPQLADGVAILAAQTADLIDRRRAVESEGK